MDYYLRANDGVVIGNYLWFSNVNSNGLYRYHIKENTMELVDRFPGETSMSWMLHKKCFAYEGKIAFIPAESSFIVVYIISERRFVTFFVEKETNGESVLSSVQVGEFIYVFPRKAQCVPLKLNMKKLELEYVDGFSKILDQYLGSDNPNKFYRTCEYKGDIIFPIHETSKVIRWNPLNGNYKVYHLDTKNVMNVLAANDRIMFTLKDRYGLGILDLKTERVDFTNCDIVNQHNKNVYGILFYLDDMVIAAPGFGRYIHGFKDGELVFEYALEDESIDSYKFFGYVLVDNEAWLLPSGINDMYIISPNGNVRKKSFQGDEMIRREICQSCFTEQLREAGRILEAQQTDLEDFIVFLRN